MKTDPYFGVQSVGGFTQKWMELNGFSQAGLADHLKVSKSMVNFVVRSEADTLHLQFIERLAPLLNERDKEVLRTILYHIVTKGLQ